MAEVIYDAYIGRIKSSLPKEKLLPALIEIARKFAYKDSGVSDALYAEKIFREIEDLGSADAFDEELNYLRAFNLEKISEFDEAKDIYMGLIKRYPQGPHTAEAYFKLGIIYTYVLRDPKAGEGYFEKLVPPDAVAVSPESAAGFMKTAVPTPWEISSLYQLGLLNQWRQDLTKSKEYYNKLLSCADSGAFTQTVNLAKQRLSEIEESRPIEYNLRTFLDVSLKEEYAYLDMSKINLKLKPYRARSKETVNAHSDIYTAESGSLQVSIQYLWSGDLDQPVSPDDSSFNTAYTQPGTKVINLVVMSPAGIVDHSIALVDVD